LSNEHLLEQQTIQPIPSDKRHGHPRDLFRLWFGVNFMPLTVVTGALGTTIFGLSFAWSLVAVVVGNAIGAVFMALHSVQGAVLGVPQMIQSRGQFGMKGSALVVVIVLMMYIGFLASIVTLGGQTLNQAFKGHISVDSGIVVTGVVTTVIVIFGYRLIHVFNRIVLPLFVLGVIVMFVWMLLVERVPSSAFSNGGFTLAGFLSMTSVAAVWQIAYAPYVSDYSRYMPVDINPRRTFWFSWGGTALGGSILMLAGVLAGAIAPSGDPLGVITDYTGGIAWLIMVIFFIGAVDASVINLYGPALCFVTLVQTFKADWLPGARARALVTLIWMAIALYLALFLADQFLGNYSNFVLMLLYVLVPWSAINLIDYYLIKRAHYEVPSFFDARGGIYGQVIWPAMIAYVIGVLVQIPFFTLSFYTGPAATALDHVDVAWLVGLVVTFVVYYPMAKAKSQSIVASGRTDISTGTAEGDGLGRAASSSPASDLGV
jgi:NCS1 family nucleobase:cation symporter-1